MDKELRRFHEDKHMLEAVKAFFQESLDTITIERVYNKEDVSGIADAKEAIDNAFTEIAEKFETLKDNPEQSSR